MHSTLKPKQIDDPHDIAYAGLAICVAARVFGADAVLYREPGTWWSWRRRQPEANRQELL